MTADNTEPQGQDAVATSRSLPLAVLGNSDSHSYQDTIRVQRSKRGGEDFGPMTFQWTEVLHRLRPEQFDLGEWGAWGTRRRYAILRRMVGMEWRIRTKEDYRFNFALSGAGCGDLMRGIERQTMPLTEIIARDPDAWNNGLVVIRMGVNSIGQPSHLDVYASTGLDAQADAMLSDCLNHIAAATRLLRSANARVRIVLVGLFDNTNWALTLERWRSSREISNIRNVVNEFNLRLQRLADSDSGVTYLDDNHWWKQLWGDRDSMGSPAYRSVNLGGRESVSITQGDHPRNAVVEDGHAGTVWNGLWANHLIRHLNDQFGLGLSPLLEAEIADLADPVGEFGIAPPKKSTGRPVITHPAEHIDVSVRELPYTLRVRAFDTNGEDITSTAVAWTDDGPGNRKWLFGDGATLQIRDERHSIGTYSLHVAARDRNGRADTTSLRLSIRP